MMKIPVTLGLVALLAACGGSGTPAVDDTPDPTAPAPEPVASPSEPVVSPPDPVVSPPDPVTFVFDNSGRSEVDIVGDTIIYDGVTYNTSDLRLAHEDEGSAVFFETNGASGLVAALILDGDATAAVATIVPDRDEGYLRAPDGGLFTVPALDNAPVGEATFLGEYVGYFIARGPLNRNGLPFYDAANIASFGDVTLEVEFQDYLSEGTFSGVIENREFRDLDESGELNRVLGLNDIIIENGGFDDTGQLTADISGGAWAFLDFVGAGDDVFDTTPGTLNGQLGGDGGTVIAGTLVLEHQEFQAFAPDFERSEVLANTHTEFGAFVVRQD